MTCNITTTGLDPVQGLVDFVNDIKPYHTKIVEVIVEYQHTESIDVTILDRLDWRVRLIHPDPSTGLVIGACRVLDRQIWGAMDEQVNFQLDNALPYLSVLDEYVTFSGQTTFPLSSTVRSGSIVNITSVKLNGVLTTSFTYDSGTSRVTIPAALQGDRVAITYVSNTPDTTSFDVTVNGVPTEILMT